LNDAAAAETRARKLLREGWAPGAAAAKLCALGVTDEVAWRTVKEAAGGAGEAALLKAALQRRLHGRSPRDERERAKHLRWLLSRGYSEEAAREAVGERDE
jgi:SOS response regulatory protein OraA/RecX